MESAGPKGEKSVANAASELKQSLEDQQLVMPDIEWKELYEKAGLKKFLRKLSVQANIAGIERDHEWGTMVNKENGSIIIFHMPTVDTHRKIQEKGSQKVQRTKITEKPDNKKTP